MKRDDIGKVLAKGLSILYQEKPKFPIDFLAKWLLNYSVMKENEKNLDEKQKEKDKLKKQYAQAQIDKENEEKKSNNLKIAD